MAIATKDELFILSYRPNESEEAMFVLDHQLSISVTSATWIGDDCLLTGDGQKLEYVINGQVCVLAAVLDKPLRLVGYLETESLVVCTDKVFIRVSLIFIRMPTLSPTIYPYQ